MTATTTPRAAALASNETTASRTDPSCWLSASPHGARKTLIKITYRTSCFIAEPHNNSA